MEGNKGQVTIFIVIGLMLLIGTGVFFYIRSTQMERVPELIGTEFAPISRYVEDCVAKTLRKGLQQLGKQGGYISPEEFGFTFNKEDPTSETSDGVELANNWKIPYWWHMKSANNCFRCEFNTNAPELYRRENFRRTIEEQLDDYVETRLTTCTGNFESLQGFVVEQQGSINAETKVTENNVFVQITWPLKVTKGNSEATIVEFSATEDVKLKKIFDTASVIAIAQANYTFLDSHTLNLISIYSGVDEQLPPIADTTFDFVNKRYWTKSNVKKAMQQMLVANIPMLQLYNSANYRRITVAGENAKTRQRILDNMILQINERDNFAPLAVTFDYLGWPIYFDMNTRGELFYPNTITLPIFNFGTQHYNAVYDISYPVIVTITDPDAFEGQGFDFVIALEANIRNNEPLKLDTVQLSAPNVFEASQLCDEIQRNSGEITVTSEPDAAIMFSCIDETCTIGSTDASGLLKANFPVCAGGIVTAAKSDYISSSRQLTTYLNQEGGADIPLAKISELRATVQKKLLQRNSFDVANKDAWNLIDQPIPISFEEEAIVQLQRKSAEDDEFATGTSYKPNEESKIRIAPGTYDVSITVLSKTPLFIPAREQCPTIGPCVSIPEINLETYQSAGLVLKDLKITKDQLEKGEIVFYAISPDLQSIPTSARKIEDIDVLSKYEDLSQRYEADLLPEFR
ncbi:MAG: hypothetical protein QW331_02085 [Candidatus Woesearchaeota archaeon]